jgi:hypothetical protein
MLTNLGVTLSDLWIVLVNKILRETSKVPSSIHHIERKNLPLFDDLSPIGAK